MKYKMDVVTRLQDNGDGGFTMYIYNNEEEMLANHPKARKWDSDKKAYISIKLSQEQRNEILNEDDPYENGYIGTDSLEIEIDDGKAKLSSPLAFGVGQ